MRYKLISSIQTDVGEFPSLHLPIPDGINNGGYLSPSMRHDGHMITVYNYSPIDILIAGLEAYFAGEVVTNLTRFFDEYRIMLSDSWVYLTIKDMESNAIRTNSINVFKIEIQRREDRELLIVLKKNAPLTFKWTKI